jgi:hypothetical protein
MNNDINLAINEDENIIQQVLFGHTITINDLAVQVHDLTNRTLEIQRDIANRIDEFIFHATDVINEI